jgi:hypothetical protein
VKDTHGLWSEGRGINQDAGRSQTVKWNSLSIEHRGRDRSGPKKNRISEGYSLPVEFRGRDKLGHRKQLSGQGELTGCRTQWGEQVRAPKKPEQPRGTHVLSSAKGGTSEDLKETQQARGTHILSGAEGRTSQDIERY